MRLTSRIDFDVFVADRLTCTTWALFLIAHASTVAYALINRSDWE